MSSNAVLAMGKFNLCKCNHGKSENYETRARFLKVSNLFFYKISKHKQFEPNLVSCIYCINLIVFIKLLDWTEYWKTLLETGLIIFGIV